MVLLIGASVDVTKSATCATVEVMISDEDGAITVDVTDVGC